MIIIFFQFSVSFKSRFKVCIHIIEIVYAIVLLRVRLRYSTIHVARKDMRPSNHKIKT